MKSSTILLLILSCAMLATAGDKPPFQTNSQRIDSFRQNNPELIEQALATIRTHFAAYYEGDLKKLRSVWTGNGTVETLRPSPSGDGRTEFKLQTDTIDLWTRTLQKEIESMGHSSWAGQQFQPDHPLELTVLNFELNSALILVEDPVRYSMGPIDPTVMFRNNTSIIFKVVVDQAANRVIPSPLSNEPKILKMMLEPINGC